MVEYVYNIDVKQPVFAQFLLGRHAYLSAAAGRAIDFWTRVYHATAQGHSAVQVTDVLGAQPLAAA